MQLLKVIDRSNIQIWERSAGYTLASGISSCAAANATYKLGLVDIKVKVHMPGGEIKIHIKENGHVHMIGSVLSVAKGEFGNKTKRNKNNSTKFKTNFNQLLL